MTQKLQDELIPRHWNRNNAASVVAFLEALVCIITGRFHLDEPPWDDQLHFDSGDEDIPW